MAFRSWEQIGRDARKRVKRMLARRASTCPQCRQPITIGDTIMAPFAPSKERGNHFLGNWYCLDCGEFFQRGVDCGALVAGGSFISVADADAFRERPDVKAWAEEAHRRAIPKEPSLC